MNKEIRLLKLTNGEDVIANVDTTNPKLYHLYNPLVMKMITGKTGGIVKVRKWMELADDDMFVMTFDKILTMSECKDDKIIAIYNNYVSNELNDDIEVYNPGGQVKLDSKMGYISSVEDARKKFEQLFKINQEPKES